MRQPSIVARRPHSDPQAAIRLGSTPGAGQPGTASVTTCVAAPEAVERRPPVALYGWGEEPAAARGGIALNSASRCMDHNRQRPGSYVEQTALKHEKTAEELYSIGTCTPSFLHYELWQKNAKHVQDGLIVVNAGLRHAHRGTCGGERHALCAQVLAKVSEDRQSQPLSRSRAPCGPKRARRAPCSRPEPLYG
jgi:hypothetical protein